MEGMRSISLPVGELGAAVVRRRELARYDGPQHCAQVRRAPGTESGFKSRLRCRPSLHRRLQTLLTRLGQVELLGAPVGCGRYDPDQTVPLQGEDVASERRAIHHHALSKRIDCQRSPAPDLRPARTLGDQQCDRCEELIVELGYVPSGGSDSEAVAILWCWHCYGWHLSSSLTNVHMLLYMRICAYVNPRRRDSKIVVRCSAIEKCHRCTRWTVLPKEVAPRADGSS